MPNSIEDQIAAINDELRFQWTAFFESMKWPLIQTAYSHRMGMNQTIRRGLIFPKLSQLSFVRGGLLSDLRKECDRCKELGANGYLENWPLHLVASSQWGFRLSYSGSPVIIPEDFDLNRARAELTATVQIGGPTPYGMGLMPLLVEHTRPQKLAD